MRSVGLFARYQAAFQSASLINVAAIPKIIGVAQTERMVEVGLSLASLSPMHEHFRLIRKTFTDDYRSLSGVLQQLDVMIVIYSQAMP